MFCKTICVHNLYLICFFVTITPRKQFVKENLKILLSFSLKTLSKNSAKERKMIWVGYKYLTILDKNETCVHTVYVM